MVLLSGISISFGGTPLFRNLDWRVGDRDRVGLVGPNGCGKTTLLRLIKRDLGVDAGTVSVSKGTTYGYLPQEELTVSGHTLFDEVMTVHSELLDMEVRMRELEHLMADTDPDGSEHARVMREYADLQHRFDVMGGFSIETRVAEVLSGLRFTQEDHGKMTEEFSGGWQMRIALAKLLLAEPTVLLLDEPTNHLDLESIIWLEEYLSTYPGAVVLVSHDRSFLDHVVSRISELSSTGIADYTGGYTSFLEQREKQRDVLVSTRRQEERRIAHLQRFVDRWKGDKKKASLVHSREKMIARIELTEIPRSTKAIHFNFPQPERGGAVTVALKGVHQSYGGNVVFDGMNLEIVRGERVALVGVNGAGKSTLMKIIADRVPITRGERRLGHNVTMQYFGQNPAKELNLDNTVLGELETVSPNDMRPRLRALAGAFMFTGSDIDKRVRVLSGGEKSRLAFGKMLLRPANLLLLDEPTNHLDVASREVLEGALSRYEGTICFVSHDRSFMDAIATKVIEVDGGKLRTYLGTYSDYLWSKKREAEEKDVSRGGGAGTAGNPRSAQEGSRLSGRSNAESLTKTGKRRSGGPKSKEQKRREAEERQRASKTEKGRRGKRRALQEEIESGERRLEEILIALADPAVYSDGMKIKTLSIEQKTIRQRVDELYGIWAELED
jgi:ATP-binding cassette subfamily F protein 3